MNMQVNKDIESTPSTNIPDNKHTILLSMRSTDDSYYDGVYSLYFPAPATTGTISTIKLLTIKSFRFVYIY